MRVEPRRAFLSVVALFSFGCFHVDYIAQAAEGQMDLLCRARSIESVVEDEDEDPRVRQILSEVPKIKDFAKRHELVPTSSYEDYVGLDRRYVVYVVSASPPTSLEPLAWTFPIAGSVPYVGWFDKTLAQHHKEELEAEGLDVDLRGASAYSTLGWFPDPVLSTMFDEGDDAVGELAETILHESLHATVYVPGQSQFNESLATLIGENLAVVWLTERFGKDSAELTAYIESLEGSRGIQDRLGQAYVDLSVLYASKKPQKQILAEKKQYLDALNEELQLNRRINNATLAGYDAYHGGAPALEALFERCGSSIPKLLAAAKKVEPTDFDQEQELDLTKVVEKIAARSCPKSAK